MAGAGITQSICLPLLSVYQLSTNGTAQVRASGLPTPFPSSRVAFLSGLVKAPWFRILPARSAVSTRAVTARRVGPTSRTWDSCGSV